MLPNFIFRIERWKFNKKYGVYVSTEGRVKTKDKKIRKVLIDSKKGYCRVKTEKGVIALHRLVMITWKPEKNMENLTVDHLNHNKRDNSLKNLEWVTREENTRRAKLDYFLESKVKTENNNTNDEANLVCLNGFVFSKEDAFKFIKQCDNNSSVSNDTIKKGIKKALSGSNKGKYSGIHITKVEEEV